MGRSWWNFLQMIWKIFASKIFSVFEISKSMTSQRPFCTFPFRHYHGCKFALIFLKIRHKLQSCLPMFAIENQQNRLVTFGFTKNRAYEFLRFSPKMFLIIKIGSASRIVCNIETNTPANLKKKTHIWTILCQFPPLLCKLRLVFKFGRY